MMSQHPNIKNDYAKRVCGMPHDQISPSFILNEEEYWVLGDNRSKSTDSRHFGPIERDNLTGRVIAVYCPHELITKCREELTLTQQQ